MPRLTSLLGICALTATFGVLPCTVYAQEPLMIGKPMSDHSSESLRPNLPLLLSGGALFLGADGTSALVGVANDRKADEKLARPIAGPWLDLRDRQCERTPCDHEGLSKVVRLMSGVLQSAGVLGVLGSVVVAEERVGERPAGGARAAPVAEMRLAPATLGGGHGGNYGRALGATL